MQRLATEDQPIYHLPIDHRHLSVTDSNQTTGNINFPFAFLRLNYYALGSVLIHSLPSTTLRRAPLSKRLTTLHLLRRASLLQSLFTPLLFKFKTFLATGLSTFMSACTSADDTFTFTILIVFCYLNYVRNVVFGDASLFSSNNINEEVNFEKVFRLDSLMQFALSLHSLGFESF